MTDQITAIRGSGLFDAEWYRKQYPDVAVVGLDPVEHYIRFGSKMRRNPGPLFDTKYYISHNPDVTQAGMNPLYHYIVAGKGEGRQIRPLLSPLHAHRGKLRRVAVFASYSADEKVADSVVYYVKNLSMAVDDVIFVSDNALSDREINKLKPYITHHICERHEEYDFGSYKRGFLYALKAGLLDQADQLILCNDSCYGPVFPLKTIFDKMDRMDCDFWGVSDSTQIAYHVQSYFLCFSKIVFRHPALANFLRSVQKQSSVEKVIETYEVPLTVHLMEHGFRSESIVTGMPNISKLIENKARFNLNYPLYQLRSGSPFVKAKALRISHYNLDGIDRTIQYISNINDDLYKIIMSDKRISLFTSASEISFSVIMPTFNRGAKIGRAIESLLSQTHSNFELIVVDDGSTDDTGVIVNRYLDDERVKYVRLENNGGVSAARNIGLASARNRWIAYLDTDNFIRNNFLSVFAHVIVANPERKTFYAQFCKTSSGDVIGIPFDFARLIAGNFIDLGAFVHSKDCYEALGGFDVNLRRLVDWDLIIKYTKQYEPIFVPRVLMEYCDDDGDDSRISVRESLAGAYISVVSRYSTMQVVTTAIVCCNQENYIAQAIESAISQQGDFIHEILIADDGSTDRTPEIIRKYANNNRLFVRLIGSSKNIGISENFKRCFSAASGKFIAILEGDDYWQDKRNIAKKLDFLRNNPECSMVFSKLQMLYEANGVSKIQFLDRQNRLRKNKLTGKDFLSDPDMNLIVNFSTCFFITDLMRKLPDRLYGYRLSEIGVAFFLEQLGPIGFLDQPLTVYRVHETGVWSGLSLPAKLRSALAIREVVKQVARPEYRDTIEEIIQNKYVAQLASLESVAGTNPSHPNRSHDLGGARML